MESTFKRFGSWVGQIASSAATNEDPDPAFQEFHQAIRLKPKDPEAYYKRGLAYLKADKNKQAVVDFDQAILLKPDFAQAHLQRGIARAQLKNYPQAVRDF